MSQTEFNYEDISPAIESRHQPEHELEEVEPAATYSSRMIPDTPTDIHNI